MIPGELAAAIRSGSAAYDWHQLELGGITVEVLAQPLIVDGVRPSCTPVEAQQAVDALGELGGEPCALLTPKLADIIWHRADLRVLPRTQPALGWRRHPCPRCGAQAIGPWELCSWCGAAERSRAEDAAMPGYADLRRLLGRPPLVGGLGKPWALCASVFRRPHLIGQPYGWHVPDEIVRVSSRTGRHEWAGVPVHRSATGAAWVIQPVSSGPAPHLGDQDDYAEPLRAWRAPGVGVERALREPELAQLVSHEGPLPGHRLPGVPLLAPG